MKIYFSGSIYGGRQKLETYQTLIKALKYNDNTYIFLNTSIEPLDSSITLIRSQ